jgi:hypothetical protein
MVEAQPWSLGQPEREGHGGSNASIAKDFPDKLTPDMEVNPSSTDTETLSKGRSRRRSYAVQTQKSGVMIMQGRETSS